MKRILIVSGVVLAVIAGAVAWGVLRASQEPPQPLPDLLAEGRAKLHAQLEDSGRREAEIEKQDWDSPALLKELIAAHQTRIDKLAGNSQAGEIVAHDKDAIARLQKRIEDLAEQAREKPAEAAPQQPHSPE